MNRDEHASSGRHEPHKSHAIVNCLKTLFLVAVLIGAWFLLDRLINGK